MTIDTHIHAWDPDRRPDILTFGRFPQMKRCMEPDLLTARFTALGITDAVVIQSEPSTDHSNYCFDIQGAHPTVMATSGWLDATKTPTATHLSAFANRHTGFRLMLNRLDADQLSLPALEATCDLAGQHGLTVDILGLAQHQPTVERLLKAAPSTRFVLNHSAQPDTSQTPSQDWRTMMGTLSKYPNCYNKLSGLVEKSAGNFQGVTEHMKIILEAFTPQRLVFASNWPIVDVFGSLEQWHEMVIEFLDMSGVEANYKDMIFIRNAQDLYHMPVRKK